VAFNVVPGGGTGGNCRGTCVGGSTPGASCAFASECPGGGTCPNPKACLGGPYNGLTCTLAVDCNGCDPNQVCTGSGTPLACCTAANAGTCPVAGSCALVQNSLFAVRVPLNGVCSPRKISPDTSCITNIECKTCVGSQLNGFACANSTQCRGCIGGSNAGNPCASAGQCPGGTCDVAGAGTCTGPGSCVTAKFDVVVGSPDGNGETPLTVPQSSVLLNPAVVSGVGTACVSAGGNGVGVIDCDGGRADRDFALSRDHNTTPASAGNSGSALGLPDDPTCDDTFLLPDGSTSRACVEGTTVCSAESTNAGMLCTVPADCPGGDCIPCNTNSPHPGVCNSPTNVAVSGTFSAGDIVIALPLAIKVLPTAAANGPDLLPCTADDLGDPPAAVTVSLSTGTNTVTVYDAGNTAGAKIGPGETCGANPCVASITGQGTSCANLNAGMVSGVKFGGGFPAFDTQAGDIGTVFQFVAQ